MELLIKQDFKLDYCWVKGIMGLKSSKMIEITAINEHYVMWRKKFVSKNLH